MFIMPVVVFPVRLGPSDPGSDNYTQTKTGCLQNKSDYDQVLHSELEGQVAINTVHRPCRNKPCCAMRYYEAGNLTYLWLEVFGDVTSRLYTLEDEKKWLIRIKIANLIRVVFSFRAMFAGLLQADKLKLSPIGTSKNVFFAGRYY